MIEELKAADEVRCAVACCAELCSAGSRWFQATAAGHAQIDGWVAKDMSSMHTETHWRTRSVAHPAAHPSAAGPLCRQRRLCVPLRPVLHRCATCVRSLACTDCGVGVASRGVCRPRHPLRLTPHPIPRCTCCRRLAAQAGHCRGLRRAPHRPGCAGELRVAVGGPCAMSGRAGGARRLLGAAGCDARAPSAISLLRAPLMYVAVIRLQVARAAQRAGADLKEGFEVGKDVSLDKAAGLWTVKSTDVSWGGGGGAGQVFAWDGLRGEVFACWEVWTYELQLFARCALYAMQPVGLPDREPAGCKSGGVGARRRLCRLCCCRASVGMCGMVLRPAHPPQLTHRRRARA